MCGCKHITSFILTCSNLTVPTNAEEAIKLQTENLEVASHSKGSSRVISRRGSRRPSAAGSAFGSGMQTPSGICSPGGKLIHTNGQSATGTRLVTQ